MVLFKEVNKLVKSSFDESIYICDKCSRTVMGLIQRDDRMEVCKSRRSREIISRNPE